ncbi:MAG: 23S rRNA (pseudouridine(1915)-N(3))-methyltransferase RlmH [Methylococcales bacterium]|jgi:23S rRNA (pseudouridine1915-N3)-methyltransferase|nr:23S rRNA (pseudouridine(1915)-N(3))-methyltransferase RlmH [Methylococcales bacterium]MBT7408747.1 23S rRNA (pseudouridine(1915)-N(3))-methyltransferase RlmH [Methylococcales bacterium]
MKIHLLSIGSKMPAWIESGVSEYQKRMPQECTVKLIEIPLSKYQKNLSQHQILIQDQEKILKKIPANTHVVILDKTGQSWDTMKLSGELEQWMFKGQDVSIVIGGPEGFDKNGLKVASQIWSLSNLTFPHMLVRVMVVEQLYRAWSVLKNHPYHK